MPLAGDDIPCEVCSVTKSDNVEMLQLCCMRCKKMFCTHCVNVSDSDFNVLSRIDCIWCCPACRPKVEKVFEVDVKVEKFENYMSQLEARIASLESEKKKLDDNEQHIKSLIAEEMTAHVPTPNKVKKLINDEMKRQREEQPEIPNMREIIQEELEAERTERERQPPSPRGNVTQEVISELHEQAKRRPNIIIHKMDELHTADEEGRVEHDISSLLELINYLKDEDDDPYIEDHFENIKRLGPYDQNKCRPLLVEFVSDVEKNDIMRKLYKLKDAPVHLKRVSVCHDMTRSQREADKVLVAQAKRLEEECQGNFIFRVRGPPEKRFIKKIPVSQERRNQRSPGNSMSQQDNQ